MRSPVFVIVVASLASLFATGCATSRATDTSRTAMEQLLIANAVDQALEKFDFSTLANRAVFVDHRLLDCTDKNYVIGALRQRVFQSGCRVVDKADEAEVVLEIHSGAVGTDRMEGFLGMPGISLPGPQPLQLPDVKLATRTRQTGTAKLGLIAYETETGQAVGQGGVALARSDNSHWSVLGVGPYISGTVPREVNRATGPVAAETHSRIALQGPATATTQPPDGPAEAPPRLALPPEAWPLPGLGSEGIGLW